MGSITLNGLGSRDYTMLSLKYNKNFKIEQNVRRLTNQLWKLIPMREHEEDWRKQLDTVLIEVAGLDEIFKDSAAFLQLLSKLEGLRLVETEFDVYRKTVFECISIIQEMNG